MPNASEPSRGRGSLAKDRAERATGTPRVTVGEGRSRDPDRERHQRLNERLRAEFIAGAEEDSRRRLGRGLTPEELERVLRRYPGDL